MQNKANKNNSRSNTHKSKESIEEPEKVKVGQTLTEDVESKLIELEKQYNGIKDKNSKNRINKIIDIYDKQAKELNSEQHEKTKRAKKEQVVQMRYIPYKEQKQKNWTVTNQ